MTLSAHHLGDQSIDNIKSRWVTRDFWYGIAGETRIGPSQQQDALEGLRCARADVRTLLAEVDRLHAAVTRVAHLKGRFGYIDDDNRAEMWIHLRGLSEALSNVRDVYQQESVQ